MRSCSRITRASYRLAGGQRVADTPVTSGRNVQKLFLRISAPRSRTERENLSAICPVEMFSFLQWKRQILASLNDDLKQIETGFTELHMYYIYLNDSKIKIKDAPVQVSTNKTTRVAQLFRTALSRHEYAKDELAIAAAIGAAINRAK